MVYVLEEDHHLSLCNHRATACELTPARKCCEMGDAAVVLATAAWIFSPLALLLPIAVRDLRRHARVGGFAPTAQSTDEAGDHARGERSGNERSGRYTIAKPRAGIVNMPSSTQKHVP
jgi:hypothetical protein